MSRQTMIATQNKKRSQDRLIRLLAEWVREIVSSYRPGDTRVTPESVDILKQSLRKNYLATTKDVYGFDIRQYKQFTEPEIDEVVFTGISTATNTIFTKHLDDVAPYISQTASKLVEKTSAVYLAEELTPRQAQIVLTNHLSNQRLTIAVTESQWVVETARRTAILQVRDPLKNSIEQLVRLIEAGEINAARRLGTKINKLVNLPVSLSQGKVINSVNDVRDKLATAYNQAEVISNLRSSARKLDRTGKKWETLGDSKVRESHSAAQGQTKDVEEPFTLAGGLLQYPGDTSLGASLNEIINCRCVTEYV